MGRTPCGGCRLGAFKTNSSLGGCVQDPGGGAGSIAAPSHRGTVPRRLKRIAFWTNASKTHREMLAPLPASPCGTFLMRDPKHTQRDASSLAGVSECSEFDGRMDFARNEQPTAPSGQSAEGCRGGIDTSEAASPFVTATNIASGSPMTATTNPPPRHFSKSQTPALWNFGWGKHRGRPKYVMQCDPNADSWKDAPPTSRSPNQ